MMTERVAEDGPTLLPYLNSHDPGLRLCLHGVGELPEKGRAPTAVFDACGAYTGLMHGSVSADGEHALCDLFFLIQPDHYRSQSSDLQPVTNTQIDKLWQTAFARMRAQAAAGFWPTFPEQIDAGGRLLPLRPLFFCRSKNRFAHALCPHCGGGLDLCRDDQQLGAAGLPGYSDSLERYLFCPACRKSATNDSFYARVAPSGNLAHLHDCDHLIQSFGRLLDRQDLAGDLPCIGCDAAGDCYGPTTRVRERLRPLLFYPFFMLMQPAPSINLLDFLALLSGCSYEKVCQRTAHQQKKGRTRALNQHRGRLSSADRFLFPKGPRLFGEVLYLKLTLLDELVGLSSHAPELLGEAAGNMSLESLWVHLPVQTTRLPLFWNFSLRIIDAVGRPENARLEGVLPQVGIRRFLASAWFYALLVNDQQPMAVVQKALSQMAQAQTETGSPPDAQSPADGHDLDPAFDAGNLVRHHDPMPLDAQWNGVWRRSLVLGFDLLRTARKVDPAWSTDDFRSQLAALRRDIRELLLREPAAAERSAPVRADVALDAKPIHQAADHDIARIVRGILERWPSSASVPSPPAETAVEAKPPETPEKVVPPKEEVLPDEDGDFQETVILGTHTASAPDEATASEVPQEELEETVWMGRASVKDLPAKDSPARPSVQGLEATMIFSAQPEGQGAVPSPAQDELDQTVVMGQPVGDSAASDDLEETIVMGGQRNTRRPILPAAPKGLRQPSGGGADPSQTDDLEQTVMIQTDSVKNRKPTP